MTKIFATSLSKCNPFMRVHEGERSYLLQKIILVVVPLIPIAAIAAITTLYILEGSALAWWIPTLIAGVTAASSGPLVVAALSVYLDRETESLKRKEREQEEPSTPISVAEEDFSSSEEESITESTEKNTISETTASETSFVSESSEKEQLQ